MNLKSIYNLQNKYVYLFFTIILSVIYYHFFLYSIIPLQTGWWQYYAFCINSGDLLYRDVYVYLPPYFSWLTAFLYNFFGNNFLYYSLWGFIFIRCLAWCLMYLILNRITTPVISFISVFFGVCITSTYLMDQVYDYNPAIFTLLILLVYFFVKIYEDSHVNICILFLGLIVGCLFMIKQTVGIVMPIICIAILYHKFRHHVYWKKIAIFILGMVISVLPGIMYLIYTNTFYSMIDCLLVATGAKVANANVLWLLYRYILRIKVFVFISMLLIICNKTMNRKPIHIFYYIAISMLFGFISERYIIFGLKYVYQIGLNNILALIILFITSFLVIKRKRITRKLIMICALLFIFCMFLVSYTSNDVAWYVINQMSWRILIHDILYASFYINLYLWGYYSYCYCVKNEKDKYAYFILLLIFGTTLLLSGISAAELESYIGLLLVPSAMSSVLGYVLPHGDVYNRIKNASILINAAIIVFLCLITKMYMPYEWHGWCASSVLRSNPIKVIDDIPGLNGFRLSYIDYNSYKVIYDLIKDNSDDNDKMYQFPNIPLFNVLLERKSYYVPIEYFDVCSDKVAELSANELRANKPDLFLWANISDYRWKVHEDIFRGGELSGQRKIQRFYKDVIISDYECLGAVDNNEGESIELWKKK